MYLILLFNVQVGTSKKPDLVAKKIAVSCPTTTAPREESKPQLISNATTTSDTLTERTKSEKFQYHGYETFLPKDMAKDMQKQFVPDPGYENFLPQDTKKEADKEEVKPEKSKVTPDQSEQDSYTAEHSEEEESEEEDSRESEKTEDDLEKGEDKEINEEDNKAGVPVKAAATTTKSDATIIKADATAKSDTTAKSDAVTATYIAISEQPSIKPAENKDEVLRDSVYVVPGLGKSAGTGATSNVPTKEIKQ